MSFSMGGYVEMFNKQCDLCDCQVFCKVCIVWYLEKIYDFFPWTHAKLYLCPYVDLSALLQTTLLVTWKKAPGQLYITQFMKSFISIRFPNFASLVVDVVTKNVFFNSCPLFSTPVLTSQFWYFDDLVGFREYFSFKIT